MQVRVSWGLYAVSMERRIPEESSKARRRYFGRRGTLQPCKYLGALLVNSDVGFSRKQGATLEKWIGFGRTTNSMQVNCARGGV
jgi:hypothetical protein